MKKTENVEYILPSGWASALINNDESGMDNYEIQAMYLWLDYHQPGYCVNCIERGFMGNHDAWSYYPYAGNCSEYTFIKSFEDAEYMLAKISDDVDTLDLSDMVGKRMIIKDSQSHVVIVKGVKKNSDGKTCLEVVYEHQTPTFPMLIEPELLEPVQVKTTDILTITIACGRKKAEYHQVKDISEIPEFMKKWKEKHYSSGGVLRKVHGEIMLNNNVIGYCSLNGNVSIPKKLF